MNSLRHLSGRMVMALALGYMAPMIVLWFLAPAIGWIAVSLGAPSGGGRGYPLFGGVIPYPSPFTWREAVGVALVGVPPAAFALIWMWSRKRMPRPGARARTSSCG
jgi:hypothetical protein